MGKFLKEHVALRITLIALCFVVGMALLVLGWKLTGQMKGLVLMLVGVAVLLASLWLYNRPFQD